MRSRQARTLPLAVALLGLLLAACGQQVGTADDGVVDLDGAWHLVRGSDADGSFDLAGRTVTLQVDGDRAGGTSACNHYSGRVRVDGDEVRLGGLAGTEMGCEPAVMELERRYLTALAAVTRADRRGASLTLAGPAVTLAFEADAPVEDRPLLGTAWLLESLVEGETVSSVVPGGRLLLDPDGRLRAATGCGALRAAFRLDGNRVEVSGLVAEPVPAPRCSDPAAAQRRQMIDVLTDGFTAAVEGDRLTVRTRAGKGLQFRAR